MKGYMRNIEKKKRIKKNLLKRRIIKCLHVKVGTAASLKSLNTPITKQADKQNLLLLNS